MVKHVVFFKLKEPTPSNCQKTKEILLTMPEQMKMIKHIQVGLDYQHSPRSYDICLEVVLENKQDLVNYQTHPYHAVSITEYIAEVKESSIAVDYEFEV